MVDININFDKKFAYFLTGILIIAVIAGLIIAYGGTNPVVHGHDQGELEGVCLSDGTNCPSLGELDCYIKEKDVSSGAKVCCFLDDGYIPVSWVANESTQPRTEFKIDAEGRYCVDFTNVNGPIKIKCCKGTLS
ncbi:hypothetical protein GF386_00030 [Candidatus Pacearchaeota archaeon]|nr:hypothetical protein [Candidatus Pacearchaeota archaeon]MBD3282667.1 hypothetical protein [Candidatus Pacearchaeota archaeon]